MANDEEVPVHDEGECYCCRENVKRCCSWYIWVVSTLIIIFSLASGLFGYLSIVGSKSVPVPEKYKTKFEIPQRTGIAYAALGGMIVGIIIGALGCAAAKCRTAWFACPFGTLSFLIGILNLVVGGAILGGQVTDEVYQQACVVKHDELDGKSGSEVMKAQLSASVDKLMCTNTCPCNQEDFATKYQSLTDAELAPFGRTNADMIAGNTPGTTYFSTYGECYNTTLKDATGTKEGIDTASSDFTNFVKNGGVEFLGDLEEQFNCAGLCYTPLFYLKKNIKVGPPTQDCVKAAIEQIGSNTGAGAVAVVTGLIFFTAAIGSIPLYKGFPAQGDSGEAF